MSRFLRRQTVNPLLQSSFSDGAYLVNCDFSFLPCALNLQPAPSLRMYRGGKGTDNDRIQKLIHLILTDHYDRPYLPDSSAHRGIEVGKVNSATPGKGRRQSSPSATVASRSRQSSPAVAMAR